MSYALLFDITTPIKEIKTAFTASGKPVQYTHPVWSDPDASSAATNEIAKLMARGGMVFLGYVPDLRTKFEPAAQPEPVAAPVSAPEHLQPAA